MRTEQHEKLLSPNKMNRISKPDLVDLLRISDRRRWIHPRIRYASIRSKPELLKDLRRHFREVVPAGRPHILQFLHELRNVPEIEYDLAKKYFLFDGTRVDAPKTSREKPKFAIRKGPVTMTF